MLIQLLFFLKNNGIKSIFIFLLLVSSIGYSQCAGNDAIVTICDVEDPANKNVDLFNLLGGSPTAGGIWIDNSKLPEDSEFDGMLNVQALPNSGVYTYTYVLDPSTCIDNEATVTLNVGPYVGVPSPNISTCEDQNLFSLFHAFDGTYLLPQQNGIWTANTTSESLFEGTIQPNILGEGDYSYTYTIPALDTCPEQSVTITVSIFRKPDAGSPSDLLLCNTDDLSIYSNLNLNDRLSGEDPGGKWTDLSSTNELTSSTDNRINVQNIYNTRGAGTYSFEYKVPSPNPICPYDISVVQIIIEDQLDFTGSILDVQSDICENQITTATYNAVLTIGPQPIPNGNYSVTYTINDGVTTKLRTAFGSLSGGKLNFIVNRTDLPVVGNFNFEIFNIVNTAYKGACNNIIGEIKDIVTIYPIPKINSATVTIDPICKGFDAQVQISGNTNLTNGDYRITYNLSGDNTAVNQQVDFTVTDGVANFTIPTNLIPNVGTNTVLSITNIVNLETGCTNSSTLTKTFTVKPLPNIDAVSLSIENICLGEDATIELSDLGSLTDITLDYSLSGSNVISNQNITLSVTSGKVNFDILSLMLSNSGSTTFTLNSVFDNVNGCSAVALDKTKEFIVNEIPADPASNSFIFCKNDSKTIGDLTPNGFQYQWFDSASSTVALSPSKLLVTGTYYVKEVNASTACESGRTAIDVLVDELNVPILDTDGQKFCGLDNPTIQNLSDKTTTNNDIVWFDAAENGNQLDSNTLLQEGMTYYGYDYSNTTDCYSYALEVTVSLSNCEVTPDFFIPDGFSPNGDNRNDVFRIPNIQFIYPDFTLEIYNRYGNLLFRGNKDKPEWDGRNSDYKVGVDGLAPNGVYFYVLHFNKGDKKPIQGRLYLNR